MADTGVFTEDDRRRVDASAADRGAVSGPAEDGSGEAERTYPLIFTGTAPEYFRIWIVNLALTIVTLGIYSAWAKVRKRRYLYGHTRIAGEGLEYRAKPLPILVGRLIALAALAAIVAADALVPALARSPLLRQLLFIVLLAIFGPWILVRSLRFNARNTAYRNIRFRFAAGYVDCMKIVAVYGWLLLLPILYPYLKRALVRFVVANHLYGGTRFALLDAFGKPFIRTYVLAYTWIFIAFVPLIAASLTVAVTHAKAPIGLLTLGVYGVIGVGIAYIRAGTLNAVWNNLCVGAVRFTSSLRARDLVWLYASNLVVIVATLGLATPFAVIRLHRYRASKTTMIAAGSLDEFAQAQADEVGATGEEIGEMLGFDVSL